MPRIALGTHVMAGRVRGVVVRHSPQGMVDIQPEGEDFIVRKRESDLRRTNGAVQTVSNPQRGASSARVRRKVEKMLHNPPSSWKALYRRAGLPARPSADDFIDIVRSKTPSGRSAEAHYGQEMGEGRHVPPEAVREAALHGLRLSYDNNYTSQSGVGLARAVQLVLAPSIDDLAKTRMRAFLTRHEKDKQGKNFGNDRNPSNGYMAWLNWGGDQAKEWLNMRNNPAEVYEKQDEQFRAVAQGVYESLMAKHLGVKSIYGPRGRRYDLEAYEEGTLSQREARAVLSRAFAIATKQGQRHGYLRQGTQQPTAKGRRKAYNRYKDANALQANEEAYEMTLSMARKSAPFRIVQKGTGARRRFYVVPPTPEINSRGYKTEGAAKGAITRMAREHGWVPLPNPSDRNFRQAVRDAKGVARAKRAGKKASHQKGIGIAGVGRGSLDRAPGKSAGGYFEAPYHITHGPENDSQDQGLDYMTIGLPDGTVVEGYISYTQMGTKMVLSLGDWVYYPEVPKKYEHRIMQAKSAQDAKKMMVAAGRPLHGHFSMTKGKLAYDSLSPEYLQTALNAGTYAEVKTNYQQLANVILTHGFQESKKEVGFASPTIGLSNVTDDKGMFTTYVVFGQGNEKAIRDHLTRSAGRSGVWKSWTAARTKFSDPLGALAKGTHKIEKGEKRQDEWYVFGPLARYGVADSSLQKALDREVRAFFNASPAERKAFGVRLPEPPPAFRYTTKVLAQAAAKALDERYSKRREILGRAPQGSYAFYVKRKYAQDDYGYQFATRAADDFSESRIGHSGPGSRPRGVRSKLPDQDSKLDEQFNAPLKRAAFFNFPWQYQKGGKKPTNVISGAPPQLLLIEPGAAIPVQVGDAGVPYKQMVEAVLTGDFPYKEGRTALGLYRTVSPQVGTEGGGTEGAWDQAAFSLGWSLAHLGRVKANPSSTEADIKKAKTQVSIARRAAEKLFKQTGVRDRPTFLLLGLSAKSQVRRERSGTLVVTGPGVLINVEEDVQAGDYRKLAEVRKRNVIYRKAFDDRGSGSDILDAVAALQEWKAPKADADIFSRPLFAAQVRAFSNVAKRYQAYMAGDGAKPAGYLWAQARSPVGFLSLAFLSSSSGRFD